MPADDDFVFLVDWACGRDEAFERALAALTWGEIKAYFEVLQPSNQWFDMGRVKPAWFPAKAATDEFSTFDPTDARSRERGSQAGPNGVEPDLADEVIAQIEAATDEFSKFDPTDNAGSRERGIQAGPDWVEPLLTDEVIARIERLDSQSRWRHLKRADGRVLILEAWTRPRPSGQSRAQPPLDLVHLGTGRPVWVHRTDVMLRAIDAAKLTDELTAAAASGSESETVESESTKEGEPQAATSSEAAQVAERIEPDRAGNVGSDAASLEAKVQKLPASERKVWRAAEVMLNRVRPTRYFRGDRCQATWKTDPLAT